MAGKLTLAEIIRAYAKDFLAAHGTRLAKHVIYALWCIAHCRTSALGGRVERCLGCGHEVYRYNSCRNRACPQCEGAKDAAWCEARVNELLPTHYFHLVFTVPHKLNELFFANQRVCYALLFQAAAKTVQKVGSNRLRGAKLGFFAILHTWGQLLSHHPHAHIVVPGGGINSAGEWVATSKKRRYFVPTKVLAKVFRGILLKALKRAFKAGKLSYSGNLDELLNASVTKPWVVHAQPPFGSPLQVIKYLSRYTRKVALSNSRLISAANGKVSFWYKDYAKAAIRRVCTLSAVEFIRRFLMHVPPPGFMRIRYYGFMAGKGRVERLKRLRALIAGLLPFVFVQKVKALASDWLCPVCGSRSFCILQLAPAPNSS